MCKMETYITLIWLLALDFRSKGFSLTKQEPNGSLTVKEGESFELRCETDSYFKYCKFTHTVPLIDPYTLASE